ncbi:MAG: DEAD/DEAH box helicase, partial [Verrucomicrobiota bacterium]
MKRIPKEVERFFTKRSWKIAKFQRETWEAYEAGESGLVHAPTGTGKSLAAWMGPLISALKGGVGEGASTRGAKVLWVTPLRALAADTARSLETAARGIGLDWKVELRTGDTTSSVKARQKKQMPECLVTTPESLSVALSYREFQRSFSHLSCVVVDEWHELISSKRGVQLELCLARIRKLNTDLRTWGLSATLGDPGLALRCLMGVGGNGRLITTSFGKRYEIRSLLPDSVERFPWSGHLGLSLLPKVIRHIEKADTTLIFTNTRSQAEIWFDRLREARPAWKGELALHHGSISRDSRDAVEEGLKTGRLRCVVCTSSLDLGVDFQPVDQVLQIGSPKGIGRLLQRAGRSGHRPGAASAIYCVPTNALELAEIAAARVGQEEGKLEPRLPLEGALDVLAQHCVTLCLAEGFDADELFEEVRSSYAFRNLSREEWDWTLQFVSSGGAALKAYPQYRRVEASKGKYKGTSRQIAQRHRMSIGTISSDSSIHLGT